MPVAANNDDAAKERQLERLSSRPMNRMQLNPRLNDGVHNLSHARDGKTRIDVDQLQPLPFSFSDEPIDESSLPQLPSLSDSSKSFTSSGNSESKNAEKPAPAMYQQVKLESFKRSPESILKKAAPAFDQQVKLPSFQKGGIHRRTVRKRNSFVAKSA